MDNAIRHKVLIVDDAPTNIHTLHAILSLEYDVLFANSAAEALEVATREHPDLLLLDVVMPDMDGYELCILLKDDPRTRDIPVIFVTAMGDVADETRGLQMGAIDYIVKPFSPSIVRMRVRNHLELKHHRDLLAAMSNCDGLTGIANRRRFDDCLRQEWLRATRGQTSLGLIMIDIDQFKLFNDRYGHVTGDDCLRRVAAVLSEVPRRPGDVLARYGGEEFACILPETDAPGALRIAEQMRQEVLALAIPHAASTVAGSVTLSLGAAAGVPVLDQDPFELLRAADDALYLAKQSGRNRAALWSGAVTRA
jgi:diguanylate cyclase (GGDEF)-like protein